MKHRRNSVAILGTRGYPSYYGGFETAVRHLAPFLASQGWKVRVYSRGGEDGSQADPAVEVRKTTGANTTSLSTLTYGLTGAWHLAWHRTDVALVMNVANGLWLPLLKIRGVKTIVNVDGIEWEREKWGTAARWLFRVGARFTAWFADQIVVDAVEIGRRWQTNYNRRGLFIPYGGEAQPGGQLPDAYAHRPYVLFVARLVPENTVVPFLDAAERISEFADVVIVGTSGFGGELDARAKQLADSSDAVHWLGHVRDDQLLFALWRECTVYFHGHSVGGTNPALVQAMACGAAVVARDTPYNREVLEDSGVFCDPDSEHIADTIRLLVESPERRTQLSIAAVARAKSEYTWERVNQDYEQALIDLL